VADPVAGLPTPAEPAETTVGTTKDIPTPPAGAVLLRYQTALDQIILGHLPEARVLLEEGIRLYGNEPNLNLLLAYLLQREGRNEEARQRLASVAENSSVAAAYAQSVVTSGAVEVKAAINTITQTPTRVAQPDARLAKLERALAQLVNAERIKIGLNALVYDDNLAEVARAHSAEMRDGKYFAHESPTAALRYPLDRYRAVFTTTPLVVAENIFRAWGGRHQLGESDVQKAHASLMGSPGHRGNILQPRITRIGIGILANDNGDIWVTQMFSRPQ
jgi:uncharacterized protein YkwD